MLLKAIRWICRKAFGQRVLVSVYDSDGKFVCYGRGYIK